MTSIVRKIHLTDYLLVNIALTNGKIDSATLEGLKRLKNLGDHLSPVSLNHKKIKILCSAVDTCITQAILSYVLRFRELKKLALISGAGIAGLAASFELRAKGFNVVIVEKRKEFSRLNTVNLNIETQIFLRKFNLLEKFERYAARIKEHRCVLIDKNGVAQPLSVSDIRTLQLDESISFEPKNLNRLFSQDGIYSIPIETLQKFLAENALEAGVNIFGDTTVRILSRTSAGGVSEAQITVDRTLQPDLLFIAEGAHSTTALQLGMRTREITNACTGENWIFGNMTYTGTETFVVSLIDASDKTLRLANMIFNAKSQVINIAVTSEKDVHKDRISELILQTAHQVFRQSAFPIDEGTFGNSRLLATVSQPVHVINRIFVPPSLGNTGCIGDATGSSSPLAGLGATLALTFVPCIVSHFSHDHSQQSRSTHENFHQFSVAYTGKWFQKSLSIKERCISIFNKERIAS